MKNEDTKLSFAWGVVFGIIITILLSVLFVQPQYIREGIIAYHEGRATCIKDNKGNYVIDYITRK